MTTRQVSKDAEALDPQPNEVELESGTKVLVNRLRTRELLKLLRILVVGAGPLIAQTNFREATDDPDAFGSQLIALIVSAVPEAEDETIDFIRSVVRPAGRIEGRSLNKETRQQNQLLEDELWDELENPEILDTLAIIKKVVEVEREDMLRLGKQIAAMFAVTQAQEKVNSSSKKS